MDLLHKFPHKWLLHQCLNWVNIVDNYEFYEPIIYCSSKTLGSVIGPVRTEVLRCCFGVWSCVMTLLYSESDGRLGIPPLISRLPHRFPCSLTLLQSRAFIKRKLGRINTDIGLPTVIWATQRHTKAENEWSQWRVPRQSRGFAPHPDKRPCYDSSLRGCSRAYGAFCRHMFTYELHCTSHGEVLTHHAVASETHSQHHKPKEIRNIIYNNNNNEETSTAL